MVADIIIVIVVKDLAAARQQTGELGSETGAPLPLLLPVGTTHCCCLGL